MRLSALLGARVVDEGGTRLGHVHDVRVRRLGHRNADGHGLRVHGLVIGAPGIRERLGVTTRHRPAIRRSSDFVEWERVTAIDASDGGVVITCRS